MENSDKKTIEIKNDEQAVLADGESKNAEKSPPSDVEKKQGEDFSYKKTLSVLFLVLLSIGLLFYFYIKKNEGEDFIGVYTINAQHQKIYKGTAKLTHEEIDAFLTKGDCWYYNSVDRPMRSTGNGHTYVCLNENKEYFTKYKSTQRALATTSLPLKTEELNQKSRLLLNVYSDYFCDELPEHTACLSRNINRIEGK